MEAADRWATRRERARKQRILFGSIAIVVVVVIVVIAVAVTLSRKGKGGSHSKDAVAILMPLYALPANNGWQPLLDQATKHPRLNFTVVVNPNKGPLSSTELPTEYKEAIGKLNEHENIMPVGYVATNDSAQYVDVVLTQDVQYASWSYPDAGGNFGITGIYYDQMKAKDIDQGYVNMIDLAVKVGQSFGPTNTVIHNVGSIPDYALSNTTDITVVFEGSYAQYQELEGQLSRLSDEEREKRGILVHGIPSKINRNDMKKAVEKMASIAGHLYVTDLNDNSYSGFGSTWADFVSTMDELAR